MTKIEEITENFYISEEERIPEVDEFIKSSYGKNIEEVSLDPIWQLMVKNSKRGIPSRGYQKLYLSLSENKYDLV